METFFMNSKNSKTSEPNRFKYDLIDKLDLINPNKNMALANLSIHYTWKNVKSTYNNNKFKISAPTWNETFDLPDGSYNISEIQDYIEYIIKKHETIGENAPILIYANTITNRIVFKIKSRYKLELLSKETMKLLGSTSSIIDVDKNSENVPKLENVKYKNKYKNKITGNTHNVNAGADGYDVNKNGKQEVELAIPLKYLGNFWRALNIPLISCEVSLELKWDKNCVITSLEQRDIAGGNRDNAPTGATLAINDCKLYVPAVTLSKDDEIKLLTNLKSGFKREIIWNKYRSQMTTEAVNNNLNILIDPTFTNVNRLSVLAYQNADDRQSFSQFYLPKVLVKDFNVIIAKLAFFDLPIKTEEEAYTILEFSQNLANVIYK